MNGWWYAAAVMFALCTVFLRLMSSRLAAANPGVRLPWFGSPPRRPGGSRWLQFFAIGFLAAGVQFVAVAFRSAGYVNAYDVFWALPIAAVVSWVGFAPYARHNRQVRESHAGR
ncbi:hypothetical protein [Dactylosporangium sp. CS-033363]|uniref:hypothetical protein n=1 Tax=Dactylosporangium sp. CS-033363 TaxID=3239935 RepID=UPI003D9400AA